MPEPTDDTATRQIPGEVIDGRYELGESIGHGGMGDVYRARDLRLGRDVAIKFLKDAPTADARRFAAEAKTLAGFTHPNLVRLYDAGESDGRAFLVMELVEGSTLAESMGAGRLGNGEVAQIGSAVAGALYYVHGKGIVHRDVKPANILLGTDGWVWLADFGIARLVDTTGMTATGLSLGTPAYLAPEQVEGHEVGPAADVYALGLVLLECMTGHRAFEGTPAEVTAMRLHRGPTLPDELDTRWRLLLRSMTARDPSERPPANEVALYLDGRPSPLDGTPAAFAPVPAALSGLPTEPLTMPLGTLLGGDHTLVEARPDGAPGATIPLDPATKGATNAPRRRLPMLAMAIVLLLGLGILLGALLFGGRHTPSAGHGPSAPGATAATSTSTAATTTTAVTTTTVAPTTTTAAPTITSAPLTAGAAATTLVNAIQSGVSNGDMSTPTGQQLLNQLDPLLFASGQTSPGSLTASFDQFAQSVAQDIQQGSIMGDSVGTLTSGIKGLASALGVPLPSTPTTAPTAPGNNPGQGHGKH